MARVRMVTRTVEQATVTVLCVNAKTREVCDKTFAISATIPTEKVCKHLSKTNPNSEWNYVAVTDYTVSEILYGMSEEKFIELADVLPPRSNSNAETNDETAND